MNIQEATWLVLMAEKAAGGPAPDAVRYWCGLDNRNGRMPVCVNEDDLRALSDEFNFVADTPEALAEWLTEVDAVTRLRVLLAEFDEAEASGDTTDTLRAADRIIAGVRAWATGAVVRASTTASNAVEVQGDPMSGQEQDDATGAT
jgi:hypothetical protein